MENSTLKTQAQTVLDNMGVDLETAFSIFVQYIAHEEPVCLGMIRAKIPHGVRPSFEYNSMHGQIWMGEDFDHPLEDFEDYM